MTAASRSRSGARRRGDSGADVSVFREKKNQTKQKANTEKRFCRFSIYKRPLLGRKMHPSFFCFVHVNYLKKGKEKKEKRKRHSQRLVSTLGDAGDGDERKWMKWHDETRTDPRKSPAALKKRADVIDYLSLGWLTQQASRRKRLQGRTVQAAGLLSFGRSKSAGSSRCRTQCHC